jgi:hypothetical protein
MSPRTASMTLTKAGLRIGIAHVPAQRSVITPDAVLIQRALLAKPKGTDWYVGVTLALCALGFAAMAAAGWLPGAGA